MSKVFKFYFLTFLIFFHEQDLKLCFPIFHVLGKAFDFVLAKNRNFVGGSLKSQILQLKIVTVPCPKSCSGTMYDLDLKSLDRKLWDRNLKSFRRKKRYEHLKSLKKEIWDE